MGYRQNPAQPSNAIYNIKATHQQSPDWSDNFKSLTDLCLFLVNKLFEIIDYQNSRPNGFNKL